MRIPQQQIFSRDTDKDVDVNYFDQNLSASKILEKVYTGDLNVLAEGESVIDLENNRRIVKINGSLYEENSLTEI